MERPWAPAATAETHFLATQTKSGSPVVGTLANLLPSKRKRNSTALVSDGYTTVFICPPTDYGLLRKALAFIFEFGELPCTTKLKDYQRDVACGATRSREWGHCNAGIHREVIGRLGFLDVVRDLGSVKSGFTKQLGRSFAASCVEQGIFKFHGGLRPYRAVELCLGHSALSSNNVDYLKVDCGITGSYKGVVLCETTARDAVVVHGDTRITKGVHLQLEYEHQHPFLAS